MNLQPPQLVPAISAIHSSSIQEVTEMAKNTGKEFREGSVDDRTQFETPSGNSAKRDTKTGEIIDVKTTDKSKFKGVAEETDARRTKSK